MENRLPFWLPVGIGIVAFSICKRCALGQEEGAVRFIFLVVGDMKKGGDDKKTTIRA